MNAGQSRPTENSEAASLGLRRRVLHAFMSNHLILRNVPNLITLARMVMAPMAVWMIVADRFMPAFLIFILAGVSDAVDGFIARRFGLRSELGAYIDPLADKALLISIYVALAVYSVLPAWLAIMVVSRDVMIMLAVLL